MADERTILVVGAGAQTLECEHIYGKPHAMFNGDFELVVVWMCSKKCGLRLQQRLQIADPLETSHEWPDGMLEKVQALES